MYSVQLNFSATCRDVFFPDQENWRFSIVLGQNETGWDSDVCILARSLDGNVFIRPQAPLCWPQGGHREHELKGEMSNFTIQNADNGKEIRLVFMLCEREWLRFEKFRLPARRLVIGRSDKADIHDGSNWMSGEHGILNRGRDGVAKFQDASSNGSYYNGRNLHGAVVRLNVGDILTFPSGLKLVYLGDCIAVNRTRTSTRPKLDVWTPPKEPPRNEDEEKPAYSVTEEFLRAPRMLKKTEAVDTEIEPPIAKANQQYQPLLLQLGPSMTMVLPMLMGTVVAGRSGMMSSGLVMIGTSSALAVMWGLVNRNYRKKQETQIERRRREMYIRYISEMEQTLRDMNAKELTRLCDTFPNAAQCAVIPARRSGELWNRMPSHPDFLQMRVGTGEVEMPCTITIQPKKLSLIDDPLRDEPKRLYDSYHSVKGAPVTISLRDEAVVGILGDIRAVLFAQGMLMQIAALHSYHDVRMAVLTEEGSASQWEWTRWLPHMFTSEDRELRMVAHNPDDVHDVVAHLDEVLTIRKNRPEAAQKDENQDGKEDKEALPLPHYIIFCTNHRILEDEPIMRQLLTNRCGMTLIVLGRDMNRLPKECGVILNMREKEGYLHTAEGDTCRVAFEYPDRALLWQFSREMAPLRVRDVAQSAAIPSLVSFLDIYGVRRVEELQVWRMWTENHTYEGLKSVIGYRAGSQPFVLDISDKYHGPHGLIAGTTGSGKSVMLETYILSLALSYSPRQVQFILIDYKGGGMADSFRNLPHVAGIIDNLQGPRVIDRALASLNGEIHRREKIFKSVGINNINDYARRFGEVPGMELPHLIIIVDEFAELKSEQPEFMAELVSASRVGRSLGIHLILATQKPSNSVSDEIWANSRFHLCLRVQTTQDSMEMLKRPDAAYIKGMGRCFIQIGNDEIFEQVQTSYSGLEYKPDEPLPEELPHLLTPTGHVVRVPESNRAEVERIRRLKNGEADEKAEATEATGEEKKEEKVTQMKAVLERIGEVAAEHGLVHDRMMWLPELPARIALRDFAFFRAAAWCDGIWPNPAGDIVVPLGLADDVAHQRYLPYCLNLTQMRNLICAGLAGSGKTAFMQTMVYSLCSLYDPEHLNIYILSLTSKTPGHLRAFPQVGDIVFDGEDLEIRRFINMIYAEHLRRGTIFAEASTDSFTQYNRARLNRGEKVMPAIVIFVDRYVQLKELFANDEATTARIQTLIQEGSGRGIHMVVTAMSKMEVPGRLHPFFGGIALQQKERADYSDVIGMRVPFEMPTIAGFSGRAMGVLDEKIFEIQLGLAGAAPEHRGEGFDDMRQPEKFAVNVAVSESKRTSDVERAEDLQLYAQKQRTSWKGTFPPAIARIPEKPTWEIYAEMPAVKRMLSEDFALPVGYDQAKGEAAGIHLGQAQSWMVYGPRRSGVTNFLKLTARMMRMKNADVYVIGDSSWKKLCGEIGAGCFETQPEISAFLQDFIQKYAKPRGPLHKMAEQAGKAAARKQAAEFTPVCVLIDNAERLQTLFAGADLAKERQIMEVLLREIAEKPNYNFSIFMGISGKTRIVMGNEPLKSCAAQGRAIALGGRLSDFDPCGVASALPSKLRDAQQAPGNGFVFDNGAAFRLVVPLAEIEEE